VAGLIHGVAPESDIRLYRVLDGKRAGDLFTLNYALHTFVRQTLEDRDKLKGAVINLSLGTGPLSLGHYMPAELIRPQLDPVSLHVLLTAARLQGIVVTAAAGNKRSPGPYVAPENPAASPDCLAVEATNSQGDRADFSRDGEVDAPGGCVPEGKGWASQPHQLANQWLTSLVWRPRKLDKWREAVVEWWKNRGTQPVSALWQSPALPSGYAYSAGTSFATPLVSGLAALIYDAGAHGTDRNWKWVSPETVYDSIKKSMGANDGVVHVPTAIDKALAANGDSP
jgi:subtilisin family serine protease